jgi:hypothetical protein
MSRPTKQQIAAAAEVLARDWDADGTKAGGLAESYAEWGAGIADVIIHEPPPGTLAEYLGVLEEQLGLEPSSAAERQSWANQLEGAVRAQPG